MGIGTVGIGGGRGSRENPLIVICVADVSTLLYFIQHKCCLYKRRTKEDRVFIEGGHKYDELPWSLSCRYVHMLVEPLLLLPGSPVCQ